MPMFFLRAVAKLDFVHIPDTAEKHVHNVFSACGANVFYSMECFVFLTARTRSWRALKSPGRKTPNQVCVPLTVRFPSA